MLLKHTLTPAKRETRNTIIILLVFLYIESIMVVQQVPFIPKRPSCVLEVSQHFPMSIWLFSQLQKKKKKTGKWIGYAGCECINAAVRWVIYSFFLFFLQDPCPNAHL